jgi:chromate transporter
LSKPAADDREKPSVAKLFGVCFLIGTFSFGGGLIPWIHREVVLRRKWLTEIEFLNGVTLGQVLPGANVTNLVVYIGQQLNGAMGAAAALLGLLLGPFVAVIALASLYETFSGLDALREALGGAAAAALGLLLAVALRSARWASQHWTSVPVLAVTVIGVGVLEWPLLIVVLVMAPVSIAIAWLRPGT